MGYAQLREKVAEGNLTEWPLSPSTVLNVARMLFVRAPTSLIHNYCEPKVRSKVVKHLAHLYIDRKVRDLGDRAEVLQQGVEKVRKLQGCASVAESLRQHATDRID